MIVTANKRVDHIWNSRAELEHIHEYACEILDLQLS